MFDPTWGMPLDNIQPTTSFVWPWPLPLVDPSDAPLQALPCVNTTWLALALGALSQLQNRATWPPDATDAEIQFVLESAAQFKAMLAHGGVCVDPVTSLSLDGCTLNVHTQSGATVPVANWDAQFGNCVRDNLPPPPPNPRSDPTQQHACNLAGFLASEWIEVGLSAGIDHWTSSQSLLDFAANISQSILSEALPFTNLFVQAVTDVFNLISTSNISALQAAMADPVLWSDVTCAIFEAIKGTGFVSDGNFGAVVANICALSYSPAIAVSAVCGYVNALGAPNIRAAQVLGAVDVVDCLSCGPWCNQEDLRVNSGAWSLTGAMEGQYVSGSGWQTTAVSSGSKLQIHAGPATVRTLTNVNLYVQGGANTLNPGSRAFALLLGGSVVASTPLPDIAYPAMTKITIPIGSVVCDEYELGWAADGGTGSGVFVAIQDSGPAPAPGLLEPCTLP